MEGRLRRRVLDFFFFFRRSTDCSFVHNSTPMYSFFRRGGLRQTSLLSINLSFFFIFSRSYRSGVL